jgi:DNA repair exonuclease SbcCD ATPase subunit
MSKLKEMAKKAKAGSVVGKRSMKIVELHAENVKRVKAVHMELNEDGGLVVVSGDNEAGKSSVMDSFMYALGGMKTIPEQPVRQGADSGVVELTLNGENTKYKVTRTFTEKGSYLTVKDESGREYKSPQSLLDSFLADLSFDPLAFTRLSDTQRGETLLELCGLKEELEENQKAIDSAYDERRVLGRDLKKAKAKLDGTEKPKDAPDEEISMTELSRKLQDAREKRMEKTRLQSDIEEAKEKIKKLKEEIEVKEKRLSSIDVPDISALEKELDSIQERNEKYRQKKMVEEIQKEVDTIEAEYKAADDRLESLRKQRRRAIQQADMPLEGLDVQDGVVHFDDVPFSQLSASQKIKVSMAIAMKQNPKLHVIRIEDGSLLDDGSMRSLKEIAEREDYHIWIERVGAKDEEISVVIEDGEAVRFGTNCKPACGGQEKGE